jgi:hypothetical protein
VHVRKNHRHRPRNVGVARAEGAPKAQRTLNQPRDEHDPGERDAHPEPGFRSRRLTEQMAQAMTVICPPRPGKGEDLGVPGLTVSRPRRGFPEHSERELPNAAPEGRDRPQTAYERERKSTFPRTRSVSHCATSERRLYGHRERWLLIGMSTAASRCGRG